MAAGTAIGKIGKIDFFACLPSGTYAFLCLYLAFSIVVGLEDPERVADDGKVVVSVKAADSKNTVDFNVIVDSEKADNTKNETKKNYGLWNAINQLIKKTSSEPTSLLLIIFSAYLLGSIFRVFPVSWSEYHFLLGIHKFPYRDKIKELIEEAWKNDKVFQVKKELLPLNELEKLIPSGESSDTLLSVYNYWKDVVCINSPEGFAYYQEFEARTRFFSGMFFAGIFGILIAIVAFLEVTYQNKWDGELVNLFYLFCTSFVISIIFALNINNVRTQEARTLTGLYLAQRQRDCKHKSGVWKPFDKR